MVASSPAADAVPPASARTRQQGALSGLWTGTLADGGTLLLASVAIHVLSLALPIMTLQMYDRILPRGPEGSGGTLILLLTGVCAALVLEAVLRLARSVLMTRRGMLAEHAEVVRTVDATLQADVSALRAYRPGECAQILLNASRLRDYRGGQMVGLLADVPFLLLFLALIAYLAGWLVLVPLGMLAAFALAASVIAVHLRRALDAREREDHARYGTLLETLRGIHTVKSQAAEHVFLRRYEAQQARSDQHAYDAALATGRLGTLGSMAAQGMVVLVTAVGAPLVARGELTTGTLIACVMLSGRVMQPVQRAVALWSQFQDARLAEERLRELQSLPVPGGQTMHVYPELRPSDHEDARTHGEGVLQCKHVGFRHHDNQPWLLHDVDLRVAAGEVVAIHGGHGMGVSTLLQLCAGIYAPTHGSILLDGMAPHLLPDAAHALRLAYLPQAGVVYRGTILENLTGFRSGPHEAHIRDAALEMAELLGLDQVIARLPQGYDTWLEDAYADPVPPGVKQRIAIARALLAKPRLILFDHADRALDRAAYNQVFQLLGRLHGRVTLVLATEDANLRSLAHRTFSMEGGRLMPWRTVHAQRTPAGGRA